MRSVRAEWHRTETTPPTGTLDRRLCALWRSTELLAGARQIDRLCVPRPGWPLSVSWQWAFKSVSGKAMFQRHTNIIRGTGVRRAGLRLP
jgi:hypothetical protein